ncbi:MAG: SUMF1/EgtB/PvdO family nonheme iron enzyme, partial [Verrucomicrobia bacterium]|nr:SUMF1/EgtB/PvdO family nonheme iron enzyme [Verrucomicrobiota bacterium]
MKKAFTFILTTLALAGMTAQAAAPSLNYEINGNELIINYTGTLLQSSDAVNWMEVQSASNPYKIALGNKKQFFCAKGESGGENITIPLSDKVNLDLIWVEPGTFTMGSPEDELGRRDDEDQHEVTLTEGYWLGKYEVTQYQYTSVMGSNPSHSRGVGLNYPVYNV